MAEDRVKRDFLRDAVRLTATQRHLTLEPKRLARIADRLLHALDARRRMVEKGQA